MISIHAPRAGRDSPVWRPGAGTIDFNPRAPCGARPAGAAAIGPLTDFNPRAPCGARRGPEKGPSHASDFNPRAPCGARLVLGAWQRAFGYFNPRAPCGARPPRSAPCRSRHDFNPRAPCGARRRAGPVPRPFILFQSTRPVRGATAKVYKITLHTFATKGNF